MNPGSVRNLRALRDALDRPSGARVRRKGRYSVPSLWIDPSAPPSTTSVEPFSFYQGVLAGILAAAPVAPDGRDNGPDGGENAIGGGWSRSGVVYNMLVRLSCAYDHDGDGELTAGLNGEGWRETGTFLKAIALLPYIRSLGADTIHLLPVQEIGLDGRRGTLGSPYAVRDPKAFDPMLGEPVTGLPLDVQFRAFVEAAHRLGIRIVLELALRTMAKDCVWAKVNPDWFYWIREGSAFHPPAFTPDEIALANDLIGRGICDGLPVPAKSYRSIFSPPPDRSTVRLEGGRWVGSGPDGAAVVIPGAFADWPPDDHQPVWADVTYLKFHQDERYNYPAYNTVRMYDSSLLQGGTETAALWDELAGVVAWYAREFRIDGVMIDMAHALPEALASRIIAGAREVDPSFAFWAEDFSRTPEQVRIGYNAVLGGQWACQHRRADFRNMLEWLGRTPELLPHLAAPETHNTPRAASRDGGERYTSYAWTISCFIPGIPYLHSGFELNERLPVNTGLGFTPAELRQFPVEELPLFSARSLGWDSPGVSLQRISRPLEIRKRFADCVVAKGASFRLLEAGVGPVIAFNRSSPDGRRFLVITANSDPGGPAAFRITGLPAPVSGTDLLSGERFQTGRDDLWGTLEPGRVAVFAAAGA